MDFKEEVIKASRIVSLAFGDRVKLKAKVEHILVVKNTELGKYPDEEQEELLNLIKLLCRRTNVGFMRTSRRMLSRRFLRC